MNCARSSVVEQHDADRHFVERRAKLQQLAAHEIAAAAGVSCGIAGTRVGWLAACGSGGAAGWPAASNDTPMRLPASHR